MLAMHSLHLLVPTKLTPPQPLPAWVCRSSLIQRLDATTLARIILVVAPAGFGKSTFVAQWLYREEHAVGGSVRSGSGYAGRSAVAAYEGCAWLTLDDHDQEPIRFLAYLVGAIARAAPEAVALTTDLFAAREPPPLFVIAQALLVDLDAAGSGLTIVLDDYHTITSREVQQLVAYIVRHLPAHCRMVLISRSDPALPLARLRAEQNLIEVRAADLRFSEAEAGQLLVNLNGDVPEEPYIQELYQQTDGWPLALQLAALAGAEGASLNQAIGQARRQIADYLTGEVLARQPEALQRMLLALSIAERFTVELCVALGAPDVDPLQAEQILEQLLRANLFIVALDGEGRWYRFHHLFRDLLQRRLRINSSPDQVRELSLRTAHWLAQEGIVEEAVRLLLAVDAVDAAADLVEQRLFPELGRDVSTVSPHYWISLLPSYLLARRPALALIMARMAVFNLDLPGLQEGLARVEGLLAAPPMGGPLPQLWSSFQADLTAMHGVLAFWQARYTEAIPLLRRALQQGATPALANQALLVLGLAYAGVGARADGIALLESDLAQLSPGVPEERLAHQYTSLTWMYQIDGDLTAQETAARRLASLVAAHGLGDLWFGYAAMSLASAAYERSELGTAAVHFAANMQRKYRVSYPGYMGSVVGLARIAASQEAYQDAEAYVHEAKEFAEQVGGAFLRHQALGCAIRVALACGDIGSALVAADQIGPDLASGLNLGFEIPRLSQALALIAAGDAPRLEQAEAILTAYEDEAERFQHVRLLIHTLACTALLRAAQGRVDHAYAALDRAVKLAEARGFVRAFVDLGHPMRQLLQGLVVRSGPTAYLENLLALFAPATAAHPSALPALQVQARFADMLTRREVEILSLLAERWSDKEIAAHLFITPNTVRKHTSTIYNKLGVSGRREAVAMGRTLGLLPPAIHAS